MADMSNEQAARVLMEHAEEIEKYMAQCEPMIECATALRMGAAALRGWVKTADRLPTKQDANYDYDVIAVYDCREDKEQIVVTKCWKYVAESPEDYPYWRQYPPLPEVEG